MTAIYESGLVKLTWFAPLNYDVSYYNIYRSNTIEGPYNLIKKNVATSEYIDTEVINGVTYYYKVSATDMFNQEGEGSNIASVSTIGDNTPPEVVGIYPADNSLFGSIAEITSLGRDNLALASLRLQYSADEGETWADVNTIATRDWATFQWDTKASGVHGTVQVRVIAMDSAGNESDGSATKTYRVDTQGPSKVTGVEVVSSTFSSIRIEWDRLTDEDTAAYIVEIKKNPEDEFMYAGISYGSSSSRVGVTIFDLLPETEYILRVVGYDRTNNRGVESEEIRATTSPDVTPPYIVRMTSPNPYSTTLPLGAECQDNLSVKALIFQYSLDSDTWLDLARVEGEGKQREILYYTMDLSEIPEGPLFIKAVVEDAAGNFSTPKIVKFEVDRTKPSKPTNFIMTPTEGYMDISWNLNSESDILGYRLYRADREGGPFEVLMIIRPTTDSVRDRKVEAGFRYWYRFVAYDKAGNESEPVTVDGITLLPDTTAPRIHTISPYTDNKVKRDPVIMVLASDNYKLRTVKLEYQKAGTSTWTEIETKNIESRNTYYDIVSFNWRTYGLTDGEYVVRATATDFGGRVSDPFIVVYDMQISPPPTAQLTATGGPWQNELEWSGSKEDPDFAYYEVQRSTKPGGPYKHIKYTEQESYIDTDVTPGQYYYYIIRATDIYGNFSESSEKKALPISVDLTAPTAVPGYDQTVIVGMDVRFDGTGSYDNDRIVRYEWDFGDGATSMFSKPTHAYSNEGVYSVKLTVYDPADNQHTDYLTVSVMEPNKVGNMQVQVLDDETGMPIAGASVVVEFPDGSTQKSVTDATGLTFVIAQGGEYIVYAYKNEYMPAMFEAKLEDNTQSSSVVRLVKGDILVGDVNVRRLTLDEIEAAGIDTNDPENMFIFEYHAQLKFREVELEIEGGGLRELTRFEGNIIYAEPREAYCEGIGDIKIQPIIIPSDYAEVPPTIAFMVIPAEARWLKEFFEVALTLTNTASAPFNLSGCLATLNLPEGISLALTAEPQSQQIDLGVIPGGESKQARWIIRGDEEGYYTINAEFTGILQPFGDTLRREFRSAEPFRVWGGDALELTMEVQDKVDKGHPYRIKVKVENVSDIPVYMFTHEMKEANKINYIYAPNQELKKTIRELPPASTLELEYTLIPAIGIDESDPSSILKFVPKESSIVQTGGNAYIDWTLKAISIPENMPGVCPVLEQINELEEGYAELSWDAIENEEDIFGNYIKEVVGYRLYRIREDLRMSEEPEMVGEYGPEVTSCTVTERNGPRDYVLTTLIKEDGVTREVTLHAITGLDWADGFDSEILIVSPEEIGIGVETEIIITAYKDGAPLGDGTVDIGEYIKDFVLDEFGQARVKITPTEEGQIVVTVYDKAHNPVKSQVIFAMYGGQVRTPVGLKAEPGHHRLTLKWNANSEPDLAGYNVYQLIDGKWTKINESIVTETSYTVLNLDLGVAYQFCISAVTTENEESPKTRPISFTLKVPDDQTPPTVAGSIPAGNAREVPVDSSITVLFSEDLLVGPNYGEVSLLVDGKLIGFVISLSKNALTIMPNEDLPYSSVCKLTIPSGAVLDYGGNSLQKAFITTFTTEGPPDTTSPEIIASAPAADETGVSIDRNVIIVLSELVIEGETFTGIQLMKGESVVETTIEIEESLLIITPKQPLDYETIYRVFIPEGAVEDTAFNPLESDHSFSFITRLAPDLGPPVVTATTPSNNETEVSLMPVITIYFSELIEEELMASPSLNCNGRPVEIVVQVGEVIVEGTPDEPAVVDYSMLIITPVEQLDEDSVCQVTIPAGAVCDNAGNSLTDAYSFSFTTVRGADTTPPTVLSMEPANLAQLVPITSSITIHFSEKIEQADEYASIKLLVNGEQVPVTLSLQNQVLTLTPDNVLPYSAVCEVVIPAGSVADLSSNACPGWSGTFTTEEAPDTIPPDLIKTSPADNSKIGVEQRNFIFVFSELIDSIDETKISVTINNEPYIGFISTIDGNILTITLQQEYNLPYSASIAIEIQSDTIADMGGNQNPKDITVTYITEADPIPYIPPLPSTSGDDEGANSDIERTMSMFSDMTEDHWAVEEISYLCGAGIMNGFPGGIFNPRGILTRAQLAAIVARAMELVDTGIARDSLPMDVPIDHWAAGYVSVVMYAGYMQGDGNDRFRPDEPVTREELTKVMIMMLGRRNLDEIHLSALEAFEDFEEIAVWARPYVEEAVKLGITNGLDQKVFGAKAPAVRVQVAVMIYRVLKLLGKVIYPEA